MRDRTVYGAWAKTPAGRLRFAGSLAALLPVTFPAAEDGWWTDTDAGVALHKPQMRPGFDVGPTAQPSAFAMPSPDELAPNAAHAIGNMLQDEGCYTFAYWDGASRRLRLVRDAIGQRAWFVRDDGDVLLFCTELAPLLDDPAFDCRMDMESAFHFLCFGTPAPGKTLAQSVTCLPAGHALEGAPGRPLLTRRYFTPLSNDQPAVADAHWRNHITDVLDSAILAQADASAILLSGGVDSSYIAATCANANGGDRYQAYTVEFLGEQVQNEVTYAQMAADAARIRLHTVAMRVDDATAALPEVLAQPQPCSAWAALTHRHLLKRIGADGHTRVLSGLGADEVFGGYQRYLDHYRRLRLQAVRWKSTEVDPFDALLWQPAKARASLFPGVPVFFDAASQRDAMYPPYAAWNHASVLSGFYRECREIKPNAHLFEMMVAHECQHRIPDLLLAGFDPLARAAGVETRYPFLDRQVAIAACALGASERFWLTGGRWMNKKLLRRIALQRIPDDIVVRSPMSYTAPVWLWLRDARFRAQLRDRLHASAFWGQGLVRREWLDRIDHNLRSPPSRPRPRKPVLDLEQLWVLTVLAAWHDRWVRKDGRRGP